MNSGSCSQISLSCNCPVTSFVCIECFHSRDQHLCICIRKEFSSHRVGLGHQRGHRFIVNFWNKRKHLHKKRVHLPQDWFGTPTWPPFHCFGIPIWPPWCHVKTLYTVKFIPFCDLGGQLPVRKAHACLPVCAPKKSEKYETKQIK